MGARKNSTWLAIVGAAAVLLAGFGVLWAFWLSGDWPTENGLFDYRSATIGDGLLLPLIVGVLIAAIVATPPSPGDRRNGCLGLAIGFLAGAATQAGWLADDSPNLNWTLPAPHEFNAPGWYHALFLSAASGLLLALGAMASTRIRFARRSDDRQAERLASSPWLGVLLAASLTLVGLLVADNGEASGTAAGMTTSAGLVFAAAIALGLLWWTFGRGLRHALRNLAIGTAASVGATAIAVCGLQAPTAVGIVTAASAVVVALALSDPRSDRPPPAGAMIAAALILLGGAALAFQLVEDRGFEAAMTVAASAAAAVWVGGSRQRTWADDALVGFTVFYVFGVLTLAAWLSTRDGDANEARLAVGASLTLLDALVITLVRQRFGAFMTGVQEQRLGGKSHLPDSRGDAVGTWALIAGLAIPALAALGVLFGIASPALGVDDVAGGVPPGLTTWLIADLAVLALIGAMAALALHDRSDTEDFNVDLAPTIAIPVATGCLIGAAGVVAMALTQLHEPLHMPLAAGLAALAVGTLVVEDLVSSTLRLQLARADSLAWALALAGGVMVAAGLFWLLAVGLWDGSRPASAQGALKSTGLTLAPLALCAGGIGVAISAGLRTTRLTEQPPAHNAFWDQVMYGALTLIVVVIPFFVVGRLAAQEDLANSGLVVLAGLGFMPALVGAVLWVLKKNFDHSRFEQGKSLKKADIGAIAPGAPSITKIDEQRKERLRQHVYIVNGLVGGIVAAGLLWLTANAL